MRKKVQAYALQFVLLYLLVAFCYLAFNAMTVHSQTSSSYEIQGQPTISAAFINSVLAANASPAMGTGQVIYDLGKKYNIDPAFALAFFDHESSFGKYGMARVTLSPGNIRATPGYAQIGGYRAYRSWKAGFEDWYRLLSRLYIGQWGLTTVDQIIPIYAPSSDHNDVSAYISAVESCVDKWRNGEV